MNIFLSFKDVFSLIENKKKIPFLVALFLFNSIVEVFGISAIAWFLVLATDPLNTLKAKSNQMIWGAYSPDITNVNLAHGRLAYVQDERGELTHPGAIDTLIGAVPFVGSMYRIWNYGLGKTDFKKDLLQKYEDFADATATTDHYINDNMSTYSSGKNNYVNFTERLIGETDIGQFNGTINLNALVGKNINDLVWDDINSASVDHLFVNKESDRQQIVNAVKNKLGTLEGVSSVVQGSDVHPGGEITGDITSIANYVRDIHGPAREKHWESFKAQYDYLVGQGIEPGTLIGRGDIFGTTGSMNSTQKRWLIRCAKLQNSCGNRCGPKSASWGDLG